MGILGINPIYMGNGRTLETYKKMRYFSFTPKLQILFVSSKTAEPIT
jgi:hypothetical protein